MRAIKAFKRFTAQTTLRSSRIIIAALHSLTVNPKDTTMDMKFVAGCLVAGAMMQPIAGYAADSDSSATTLVKDSAITTQIKADLAEKKLSSLVHVSVDTDNHGMVTLSGTVPNKKAANEAVSIARGVKGVTSETTPCNCIR